MFLPLALLVGRPSVEPTYVSRQDLDQAHARGDTAALCAGLKMEDADTRYAAAEKLKDYNEAAPCLCERLTRDGQWDPSALGSLKGAKDATRVACAGALLDDAAQQERVGLPLERQSSRCSMSSSAPPSRSTAATSSTAAWRTASSSSS